MSWSFKPGDKVVCVKPQHPDSKRTGPVVGGVYKILSMFVIQTGHVHVHLAEFEAPETDQLYEGFAAEAFRPLVAGGMKTLRSLLAPSDVKEPA